MAGCSPIVAPEYPSERFESFLADAPSVQDFVLDSSRTGPLEPFSVFRYTVATPAGSPASELRALSRDLTEWINENSAPDDTRIHVRLQNGEESVGLSPINEANDARINLVETAMDTGLFASVSLRAPWQGDELSDDDGYTGMNLLVAPSGASTPGSALLAADALLNAGESTGGISTVMTADLDEYSGVIGASSRSSVRTNAVGPVPEEYAVCVDALFALTEVTSFTVAIPASGFGNKVFLADENVLPVQHSLADQHCGQILAPITYQPG